MKPGSMFATYGGRDTLKGVGVNPALFIPTLIPDIPAPVACALDPVPCSPGAVVCINMAE